MKKQHKHAELIKAWADGAEIQIRAETDPNDWFFVASPSWDIDREYRIKPAAPKWPETTMTRSQLNAAFEPKFGGIWNHDTAKNIANAAIAHALETGQVFTKESVDKAVESVMDLYKQALIKK